MSGLQLQAQATLARADESLFDVVILAGAVEAEHYEIGVYETLVPSTEALGASMAAHLLEENVEEERAALEAFKALAKRIVREGSTFSV